MPSWLLLISHDTELARALSLAILRTQTGCQLWTVTTAAAAREHLARCESLPAAAVLDQLFLEGEPIEDVVEEFSWFAPVIAIGQTRHQPCLASLVAEGRADFLSRDDHFIPLAAALVERALRWEKEVDEQILWDAAKPKRAPRDAPDPDGFPAEALRILGGIIENLEVVLSERRRLPVLAARRLGRAADLAFDLKSGLRLLAEAPDARNDPEPFPSS